MKLTKEHKEYIEQAIKAGDTKQSIIDYIGCSRYLLNKYLDNKVDVTEKDKSPVVIQQVQSIEEKLAPSIRSRLIYEFQRINNDPVLRLNYTFYSLETFLAYFHQSVIDFYRVHNHIEFKIIAKDGVNIRRGNVLIVEADNE